VSRFTDFLKRLVKADGLSNVMEDLEAALRVIEAFEPVAPAYLDPQIARAKKCLRSLIRDLNIAKLVGGL
jgi:hypothetical protein